MSSVHWGIALLAAVRLLESEYCHFSKFTVLGFLTSTADATVVPQRGSVHLGLGNFFSRFTPLDSPCSIETGSPLVRCSYSLRTGGLVCREVSGLCLKLHYCTPGLVRTSAGSTPYKGTTSPIPIQPLLLLSSSSSSSALCRVFILIFLRQTMSLGNTVLQLFCCYYSWCLYR